MEKRTYLRNKYLREQAIKKAAREFRQIWLAATSRDEKIAIRSKFFMLDGFPDVVLENGWEMVVNENLDAIH